MITFKEFTDSLQPIELKLIEFYKMILEESNPKAILEVGSGWGLFTRCAVEWTEAHITTIDKIPGYGLKQFLVNTAGCESRYTRIETDSHILLPEKGKEWKEMYDFIFVDGDHTKKGAMQDLADVWCMLKPGGYLMLDDVFHKENFNWVEKDGEHNFGVTEAFWSFLNHRADEVEVGAYIAPVAHGVAIVQKKHGAEA